jgi:hypothetical protein
MIIDQYYYNTYVCVWCDDDGKINSTMGVPIKPIARQVCCTIIIAGYIIHVYITRINNIKYINHCDCARVCNELQNIVLPPPV